LSSLSITIEIPHAFPSRENNGGGVGGGFPPFNAFDAGLIINSRQLVEDFDLSVNP